jgi:hypothetical protein
VSRRASRSTPVEKPLGIEHHEAPARADAHQILLDQVTQHPGDGLARHACNAREFAVSEGQVDRVFASGV